MSTDDRGDSYTFGLPAPEAPPGPDDPNEPPEWGWLERPPRRSPWSRHVKPTAGPISHLFGGLV